MIGSSVRSLYRAGKGFPCFVSSEQDGAGSGLAIALAISRAIGATKAGAIESSVREETAMDLFAEQALWPNIISTFQCVRLRQFHENDFIPQQTGVQRPKGRRMLRRGVVLRNVS